MTSPVSKPPARALLRLAGVFTQVAGAFCLLLGTIAFVLVHQNQTGGTGLVIAWAVAAMAALVAGGLMTRGGLIAVLASALLDFGFGIALLALDNAAFASLLRVLDKDDVEMIADAVAGGAVGMLVVGALCLASIPQAIRYNRWLHEPPAFIPAGSTERGFPPPPISAATSLWRTPATPPRETRSRRRMYFALAGFAIGFGAGIGVLVSSTTRAGSAPGDPPEHAATAPARPPDAGAGSQVAAGSGSNEPGSLFKPTAKPPATTVQAMLQDQRAAIARGDLAGVLAAVAPQAVGFGVDADEVAIGRDAIEAQLRRDLGDVKSATVDVRFSHVGGDADTAWVAQELDVGSAGRSRRFAITQVVAAIGGRWQVVAWHWAVPVSDAAAERAELLGGKPVPRSIVNKLDGPKDLDAAVRAAFGSRAAFAEARSERDDAFNFGSAPNERMQGGAAMKRYFATKLRADIKLHDGVHVVGGGAWDLAQKAAPRIGIALLDADLTAKTRAATELTQTFRVLAVLVKEPGGWKLVQTQWSHGGPIR